MGRRYISNSGALARAYRLAVVEAAVKQFGIRMKSSEKFWNLGWTEPDPDSPEFDPSQTGAEEMLALRCLYLSEDGRWQKYWEERGRPKKWT